MCAEPEQEQDVHLHYGGYFRLRGDDGVGGCGGCGGVGESGGSDVFRSRLLVRGRGGMFEKGFLIG